MANSLNVCVCVCLNIPKTHEIKLQDGLYSMHIYHIPTCPCIHILRTPNYFWENTKEPCNTEGRELGIYGEDLNFMISFYSSHLLVLLVYCYFEY